jgi:sulfate adenylyltransferase subunit 1 (EFTu-like GTPase family)
VAYRYFATPKRKFIIADTPGHVQYTRNMVTGASTADLGLVLVDARQGLTEQSRRHAVILSLLRVPHLVLAVNKMDLVDYDEATYNKIHEEFASFATKLSIPDLEVIPISALKGDNVVTRSENMPWYDGQSLMHHLENVHVATATWSTSASRCSTSSARSPTSSTTTVATQGGSPAGCSSRATTCWSCPRG